MTQQELYHFFKHFILKIPNIENKLMKTPHKKNLHSIFFTYKN